MFEHPPLFRPCTGWSRAVRAGAAGRSADDLRSMNNNLAQRTQFFGMMRGIGMSKPQLAAGCGAHRPCATLASWTISLRRAAVRHGTVPIARSRERNVQVD